MTAVKPAETTSVGILSSAARVSSAMAPGRARIGCVEVPKSGAALYSSRASAGVSTSRASESSSSFPASHHRSPWLGSGPGSGSGSWLAPLRITWSGSGSGQVLVEAAEGHLELWRERLREVEHLRKALADPQRHALGGAHDIVALRRGPVGDRPVKINQEHDVLACTSSQA